MSLIGISSRLLQRRTNTFCIRNLNHERPNLRFGERLNLTPNRDQDRNRYHDEDYAKLKQPIDAIGYFLLGVPILTFILGTWQVQRRKWKLGLIDDLHKKTTMPSRPLPEDLNELAQMEYYLVKVRGEFLYEREFSIGPKSRMVDGSTAAEHTGSILSSKSDMGFNIITPFKVENRDTIILVNRGWVPKKHDLSPKEKLGHVSGPVEITGIVRLTETRQAFMPRNIPSSGVFIYRDVEAMANLADTDPVFLDLVTNTAQEPNGPIPGQTRIYLRNEHLSYIITWYSLSALTAFMWHRLYIRKLPLW